MKYISITAALICVAIMALPTVAMPFYVETTGMENRDAAAMPQLVLEDGTINQTFSLEFESWFCDHFSFRKKFVQANAWINLKWLHTSPSEDVILGRDGMLFFCETVPDFEGTNPLTEVELAMIARNVDVLALSLEQQGARLFIAVVPNKSSVYPEHMPGIYSARTDDGNIGRVQKIVRSSEAEWIDLLSALTVSKSRHKVYYDTDTHWNEQGAYIAAQSILTALDRTLPNIVQKYATRYSGDLARMAGLGGVLTESSEHFVIDARPDAQPDFSLRHVRAQASGNGELLMLRDSFGTAIAPFLVPAYETAEVRWETPFEAVYEDVAEGDCNALILIAERNIRLCLLEAPVCIAPIKDAPQHNTAAPCELEVYMDGDIADIEFRFSGQNIIDGYVCLDDVSYWCSPMMRNEEDIWYRALLPRHAIESDPAIQLVGVVDASTVCSSADTWQMSDLVDLDAVPMGDEDDDDDYEWLRQLRKEMEADG